MGLWICGRYYHCCGMTHQNLLERCAVRLEILPMEYSFRVQPLDNHLYGYRVDE